MCTMRSSAGVQELHRGIVVQEYYRGTGVGQGYRSSTCVQWVHDKYRDTGVQE
jgi:hypothetical protein